MRCPNCGTDNADDALFCGECGTSLSAAAMAGSVVPAPDIDAAMLEREVDERMRKLSEALEDETRLINNANESMQPVYDAAQTVVDGRITDEVDPLDAEVDEILSGVTSDEATDEDVDEGPDGDETVLAPVPVEATMLRPAPQPAEEQHFVVRNTRDYDHDAQSVNLASGHENFETIAPESSKREVRRDPYARGARRGDVPGEGNSRSKLRPVLAILLVALILGGGGSVLTYGLELWGGKRVPDVVGQTQANAEYMLGEKGLSVRVEAEPADDAIGRVLSQEPESGIRVPESSEITIVVASNRTMPEVLGLYEDEAKQLLADAGAERIEVKTEPSSEVEGTVIRVSPEPGQPFVSRSTVTLTVAAPFTVPDVVGMKETDAVNTLNESGYQTEVTYITSSETVRTVVETSPGAGEILGEGETVTVKVSSPYPSDIYHLIEYFDHSSQDVDQYLQKKDFAFDQGFIDSFGNALATYTSSDKGNVTFSSQPYVRSLTLPKEGSSNVLSTGVPIAGVRIDLPASMNPSGYEKKDLEELAKVCGFEGSMEVVDSKTMPTPSGYSKTTASFVCGSGTEGDLVWTICAVGSGSSMHTSITCARESVYRTSDVVTEMSKVGNSVARYVAFQEAYLSSAYVAEKKTDEKSDSKSSDKKSSDKKDDAQEDEQEDDEYEYDFTDEA